MFAADRPIETSSCAGVNVECVSARGAPPGDARIPATGSGTDAGAGSRAGDGASMVASVAVAAVGAVVGSGGAAAVGVVTNV